jgi:hypothetical protein
MRFSIGQMLLAFALVALMFGLYGAGFNRGFADGRKAFDEMESIEQGTITISGGAVVLGPEDWVRVRNVTFAPEATGGHVNIRIDSMTFDRGDGDWQDVMLVPITAASALPQEAP